jgi:hypothetical protein
VEGRSHASAGNRTPVLQPVDHPCTDWAVIPKCDIHCNIWTTIYCRSGQLLHTCKWKPHIEFLENLSYGLGAGSRHCRPAAHLHFDKVNLLWSVGGCEINERLFIWCVY